LSYQPQLLLTAQQLLLCADFVRHISSPLVCVFCCIATVLSAISLHILPRFQSVPIIGIFAAVGTLINEFNFHDKNLILKSLTVTGEVVPVLN
jgi:hypothetical protein